MERLLIKNVTVVTMDDEKRVIEPGDILIEGSRIVSVRLAEKVRDVTGVHVIDGTGKIAFPGLINAHTHAAMTLLRGYADDMALQEWLQTKIWPREAFLKGEDVYWGTMLAIVEMIKGGTTCFADMYFFTDEVAQAVKESGIRASLCGVLLGILPSADQDLRDASGYIEKWHGHDERISMMFGPHSLYACQTAHLKKIAQEARRLEVGIHIHLLEARNERGDIIKFNGQEPFVVLEEAGLLGLPILAAHAAYLTPEEILKVRELDFTPVHCPGSNLKLASGIAPIPEYLKTEIIVGIGTDGAASNNNLDMFEEIRLAALIHKADKFDPTIVSAGEALEMATRGGAKALGFEHEIGQIKEGMRADIILIDRSRPHLTPEHNIAANLVYSASAADVTATIVNGQLLMEDRKLLLIDEVEVMARAAKAAVDLVNRN